MERVREMETDTCMTHIFSIQKSATLIRRSFDIPMMPLANHTKPIFALLIQLDCRKSSQPSLMAYLTLRVHVYVSVSANKPASLSKITTYQSKTLRFSHLSSHKIDFLFIHLLSRLTHSLRPSLTSYLTPHTHTNF